MEIDNFSDFTYAVPPYLPTKNANNCKVTLCRKQPNYICKNCRMRVCWNHVSNFNHFAEQIKCMIVTEHLDKCFKCFISFRTLGYLIRKYSRIFDNFCLKAIFYAAIILIFTILFFIDIPFLLALTAGLITNVLFYIVLLAYFIFVHPIFCCFKINYYCLACTKEMYLKKVPIVENLQLNNL